MTLKQRRDAAIAATIGEIKILLAEGPTPARLEAAKAPLMALCARAELFPESDFPLPPEPQLDRSYLVHEEADGGYALYLNASRPGQQTPPHDHGGSWAIVAAIAGEETHDLYVADPDQEQLPQHKATITVRPGTAVSVMPEGLHAIHAEGDRPLMHLHLYAKGFAWQGRRREYDPGSKILSHYHMEDLSFVEDAR